MRRALAAVLFATCAGSVSAQGITLFSPINCDLSGPCFIQQFTDRDPGPYARDFTCGGLSYDGHKGTDFALPSLAMQAGGVDVRAAAPGVVRAVRDGVADILQGTPAAPDVTDMECGNGVVIDHDDGWTTQYCHMAKGSMAVDPGQTVAAGDTLGLVGLSGQTEFPHLHLSVRHNDAVIDPFAADALNTCGNSHAPSLWADPPPTPHGGIIAIGWASGVPTFDAIKAGTADLAPDRAENLVLWGFFFGGQPGDAVMLQIDGPEGTVFTMNDTLDRAQAQLFRAGGKRVPPGGWAPGLYRGAIVQSRGGVAIDRQETETVIP